MTISRNEHAISDRKQSLRRQSLSDKHALDDKRIVVAVFGTCCDGRRARANENICKNKSGRWGGIRTHGTLSRTPVFKTGSLNHSDTHPSVVRLYSVLKKAVNPDGARAHSLFVSVSTSLSLCRCRRQQRPLARRKCRTLLRRVE